MSIKNSLSDVIDHAAMWHESGHAVDLVTVVKAFGSSPRPVGSVAAIRHDGLMVGSVSGGCIEKQLVERLRSGNVCATETYHVSEEEAKRYGLMCGGHIELLFERVNKHSKLFELKHRLDNNQCTQKTLDVQSGHVTLNDASAKDSLDNRFTFDGTTLVTVLGHNHHLIIIGANELARFTCEFAMAVDFNVSVVEPREEFRAAWPLEIPTPLATMPDDAVIELATHDRCGVLALTHDPNLDDLALYEAISRDLFFVGALGSKASHNKRLARLGGLISDERLLSKIQGPIGLNIGSRTSAEIGVSIIAELISRRSAKSR